MKKIIVTKNEVGIRLNKLLIKIFPVMPNSLMYKLLRKKYFKINDISAKGNEILVEKDVINIFLSEETIAKYSVLNEKKSNNNIVNFDKNLLSRIIYEDRNLIIYNKPAGFLSQDDKNNNFSVNKLLNEYVKNDKNELYNPSIVNRLDRNTEGILIFAKTYIFARDISKMILEGNVEKYYKTYVNGNIEDGEKILTNLYKKNEKNNKAIILKYENVHSINYSVVKLSYKVVEIYKNKTLVDIQLITGKSHQIRAQFAFIGHPLICDKKYMSNELYNKNVTEFGENSYWLQCYKIKFGNFTNKDLKYLNNKIFELKI